MYRFLIVDDEYYIRQHIRCCIPWEDYDFQYAGEGSNAAQAMEFLEHNAVELILLDISMPGQSGMDLLKLLDEKKRPHVIILTGFATFEYAREALKYGVSDYLLKPIKPETLTAAITSLKAELDREGNRTKALLQLEWTSTVIEQETRRNFFRSLYTGHIPDRAEELLEAYGIRPSSRYLILILDTTSRNSRDRHNGQKQADRLAMNNCAEQLLASSCFYLINPDGYGRSVILLENSLAPLSGQELTTRLQASVSERFHLSLLSGYSISASGKAGDILAAYQNSLQFFWLRTIYGETIDISQVSMPSLPVLDSLSALNNRLRLDLSGKQETAVLHVLDRIFLLLKKHLFPIQALESEIVSLMGTAIHHAAEKHLDILCSEKDWNSLSCTELIQSGLRLEEIKETFTRLFSALLSAQESGDRHFIEEVVLQSQKIIDRDFAKACLSLNTIASELLVSPSYLSRSFTKIQGISLTAYITRCRMEHARDLPKTTDMSIAQISEQSGYSDLFYFSKRFKSFWGVPPSRYRLSGPSDGTGQEEE